MNCSPPVSSDHGTSREKYWSGSPYLSPGDLPDPRIEPASPAVAGRFFLNESPEKPSDCRIFSVLGLALSHVWLFVTPWTATHPFPLSMGIPQARILEWVAMPSSRGSSQPRDRTQVSHIAGGFFTDWATKHAFLQLCNHTMKSCFMYVCYYICVYALLGNNINIKIHMQGKQKQKQSTKQQNF